MMMIVVEELSIRFQWTDWTDWMDWMDWRTDSMKILNSFSSFHSQELHLARRRKEGPWDPSEPDQSIHPLRKKGNLSDGSAGRAR